MTESEVRDQQPSPVREICAAIDIHAMNPAMLQTIVLLAERLKSSLVGLFVQDLMVQQVAELPFTTEVVTSTGEERSLYAGTIKRRREKLLSSARRQLVAYSDARKVPCRVDIRYEKIAVRALLAESSDVILPSRHGTRSFSNTTGIGTLRRVKLFYDGSAQASRALEVVTQLVVTGLTKDVYLISDRTLPSSVLSGLATAGARVYLVYSLGDQPTLVHQLLNGPKAELQLLPLSLAQTLDDSLFQMVVDRSRADATYVVA